MNKSMKFLLTSSIVSFYLAGTTVPASAAEPTKSTPPMMQGQVSGDGAPCPGYGPGMMGGAGAGMMGGKMGSGYSMGQGMMNGWGGGMGAMSMLDLTDAQTAQMEKIQVDMMKQQHPLMRQMWDAQDKLDGLMKANKRDLSAIGKAYVQLADMQQQALAVHIDAENKMAAILTKEQQGQMHRGFGRGMMGY
ncbi:Spy/CpxP family protein refolding chaperone [Sulfuriferula nivalis]|uniref:Periplasmic heavy metal sensor n=1 Tax=Sulfuriferula nivalis TaxID=2675298 RepID=A0A809RH44_9PROT|nr:Spy/CpxP family protein refolding chaperone [Sulfuriferula nivalis]BBP00956.1 hypothetical protein SFSGTM_16640 [Sulfuriferula nivalis]